MTATPNPGRQVGLFVTCLVDLYRPSVGFAAVKLLQHAGCAVTVPAAQTCCGQPAYNAGDRTNAAAIARQVIDAFRDLDHVVAPSGSCAAMLRCHYPELLADDPAYADAATALSERTWELVSFLTDICGIETVDATCDATATYHDSCSGLRELGVKEQPRRLLGTVSGLALEEMADAEVCCGFGGTFCVKYPDISEAMVSDKTEKLSASGADLVLAGDLGCLMNMAGRLSREGRKVTVRHVAEVLAGMTDGPAIGEDRSA